MVMAQCTAWTKRGVRCIKQTRAGHVCSVHTDYYENWLTTHPPIAGWRLDPSEEYRFQIEHGYVPISEDYVRALRNGSMCYDYYEYLTHLPHISWDCNLHMLSYLYRAYFTHILNSGSVESLDVYFANMFQNPTFYPGAFVARFILTLCHGVLHGNQVLYLSDAQTRATYTYILSHPLFEGWMYTDWCDRMLDHAKTIPSMYKANSLNIFLEILAEFKKEWRLKKQIRQRILREECMAVAWHPSRVVSWCIHESTKRRWTKLLPTLHDTASVDN